MQNQAKQLTTSPSIYAWLMGGLSLLLVSALCIIAQYAGENIYKNHLLEQFTANVLGAAHYSEAQEYIEKLISASDSDVSFFIDEILVSNHSDRTSELNKNLRILSTILMNLSLKQSAESLRELTIYQGEKNWPANSKDRDKEYFNTTVNKLQDQLNQTISTEKEAHVINLNISEIIRSRPAILKRAQLLANDFAEYLGLRASIVDNDLESSLYTDGVLAGLPKIEGISDNILDLASLKEELEKNHGAVKIDELSALSPYDQFHAKIEQIKSEISSVATEFSQTLSNEEQLKNALAEKVEEIRKYKSNSAAIVKSLILLELKETESPLN